MFLYTIQKVIFLTNLEIAIPIQIFTIRNIFILHLYIIIINKSAKWHCGRDTSINKM